MRLLFAAGLAGFAVLAVEIVGVHQLAPWFGASALVWSNQIGIVLLAMAAGGWLGGARARATADPVLLAGRLLLVAGVLLAAGVVLLPLLAGWLLPDFLRLEEAAAVFRGGSLAAALLFCAPPVFLLAMVTPLLVEARAAQQGAGRAAGDLYAAGTAGSLAGVFGTTWLALPFLGVRVTLLLTGVALVLAGLLLTTRPRRQAWRVALPLLPLLLADPAENANLPPDGAGGVPRVLRVQETPYQRLRVLEFGSGERWLQMNEGLDSYQSVWRPGSAWPGGYYDLFVLAPVYALEGRDGAAAVRFWSLGFGAGAWTAPVAAALEGRDWSAVGVELDPGVVALGTELLPLHPELRPRVQVVTGVDARALLRAAPPDLDFVLLDAYTRQFELPPHLATEEFFAEVFRHLRSGGVLAVNVGAARRPGAAETLLDALRAAVGASFGTNVRLHTVPATRNAVLFARKERPFPDAATLAQLLPENVPYAVGAACMPERTLDGVPAQARRFTDDRNAVMLAQLRLWLE
ncbi:MAG: hypothetical protein EYC70_03505 [Planctomycetota bacterium]|nr:MAG: hypothetical protein EYC70_03505 [Planctomycetota bacterium]